MRIFEMISYNCAQFYYEIRLYINQMKVSLGLLTELVAIGL